MRLQDIFRPSWKHKNPGKRLSAISKLTSLKILQNLIIADENYQVRQTAMLRYRELFPKHWSKWDLDKKLTACSELNDPILLSEVAEQEMGLQIKQTATSRLLLIAEEAYDPELREMAVRQIENQRALFQIALRDSDVKVRQSAASRVTAPDFLTKLVETLPSSILRFLARKLPRQLITDGY